MQKKSNIDRETGGGEGTRISLDLPARGSGLFSSQAAHDVLTFLARHHTDEFSITELQKIVEYSQPTVSKAVDVLVANNLAVERREGNTRGVRVNRDRLSRPDDPILQIPQSEFQPPVRAAVEELRDRLETVLVIILYGSVACGEADRRSDIDLWVLVGEGRMTNQRTANRVRQDLEGREFDTGRYVYEIDVEGYSAVPNYADEIREILSDGFVVYEANDFDFETECGVILHGDING
jgi:predicted nucleotidyltransferase